jgi:hypothetical protein
MDDQEPQDQQSDDGEAEEGDTIIELRNGVPYIYEKGPGRVKSK